MWGNLRHSFGRLLGVAHPPRWRNGLPSCHLLCSHTPRHLAPYAGSAWTPAPNASDGARPITGSTGKTAACPKSEW